MRSRHSCSEFQFLSLSRSETREANPGFVELRKISVAKEISSLLSKC